MKPRKRFGRVGLVLTVISVGILSGWGLSMAEPRQARASTVLVIHGGAGPMSEAEMTAAGLGRAEFEAVLAQSLAAGYERYLQKRTSVEIVESAIRVLEDSELFNAGRGAVLTADGRAELDASIMEGRTTGTGPGKRDPRKRAGAVTGVTHVKNPISAARAVMEMPDSRHLLLAGAGAEEYVLSEAVRTRFDIQAVSNLYFWTDRQVTTIRNRHRRETEGKPMGAANSEADHAQAEAKQRFGTVGAVARDTQGQLAAGTSTGGMTGKATGRIGDSPIIGAGTYADDRACGVSCTGTGELFIRHAVAHDVVARMLYGKATLKEAVSQTIAQLPDEPGGVGGLIALTPSGEHQFGMTPLTDGMYRGYVTSEGEIVVAIFAKDVEKTVKIPRANPK
ncbi:isoaspartyl peptidase/L-asparaginase family protein [Tuwongella immobilis]|uniref:Isoaspartyl peptidase n=1 Tax=Tuwongella immobilis TaxID=692036 RepID=A0A6C2YRY0_9BACT|nr:isoaspartyl peptidase/L-asparaginase [Tuwongella immobilis]VIP04104.1 isoaspartyl peptidase : Beta-aspartyl-peptidase (Threonine type) OS=Fibrisoma limi BUZ 3 GN=BN8_06112 PE=4 SV=1: Asparaginase_2 [Tuwongella immobilis]VTS05575.1 isoaspartyl peptidase : Beta-aspartyl-peptidase (Threonine type) OS=Fibrisoma limi BUZ 3 GN=BN8_06112 PE=4 SV=1: Asparaginase_2 [Tuwongella immobilis]